MNGKTILITGGTGTLGSALVSRIQEKHNPEKIIILSRDERKQHQMKLDRNNPDIKYRIGDIGNYQSVVAALRGVDVVINTAALKHVPVAEQFPMEAMRTNVLGAANIIRCIQEQNFPIETVIGISTDKACNPNSAYGITKAMMEKLMIAANCDCHGTRFVLMRSGNLLASRGSILPIFKERIQQGKDISITDKRMTRLFITLDQMVDTVMQTYREALPGEIFVPKMPSCRILDIAKTMIGKKDIKINYIGMRSGERLSEPIISKEELVHTYSSGEYYVIHPMLLGAFTKVPVQDRITEYSSDMVTLSGDGLKKLLEQEGLIP